MPAAITVEVAVALKPLPKSYIVPPVAVNTLLVSVQFKLLAEVKPAVGKGLTVVVAFAEAVQPLPSVTVTVNVAAVLAERVPPVVASLHIYVTPVVGFAVSVVLLPAQNAPLPLIAAAAVGTAFTITVTGALAQVPVLVEAVVTV